MKKWIGLIGACALSLGLTPAFGAKDTLTIGIASEFETLNPMISSQAATKYMLYLAYRPLVVLSPDGKWIPLLIKEIPTIENKMAKKNGEKLDVTFELLDNAQWGDGQPVICKDIEFAWKIGKDNNVSIASREAYENITAVTADKANPKKCTIAFAKTKFDYFANLPDPMPSHLEESVHKKFGGQSEGYDRNSLYVKAPTTPGLYNGPYMISDVKLGSHVIFIPNPKWQGKKPYFQKIIFKLIPNSSTMEANLRSGNIDMICPAGGIDVAQGVIFERKVKSENLPHKVVFEDGVIYAHIDLNLDNPILKDLKVRQALSYSFNKKEMIDSLLEGRGKVANHFLTESDPWATNKVEVYNYNKRKANSLLDEAGWKMGASGYREKNGKTLALTLMAASGAKVNELIETYLQDKFKAIGVQLQLKNEPARVFFGETTTHRNFEMALFSWVSIPESSPRSILHSSMIPSAKNSWAGQNFTGYKNPEVDKWIDALEQEMNAAKRAEIGKKIVAQYTKDIPVIPVYYRPNVSVIPKDMKNYRLSGHMFYESLYAENWSM